MVTVFIVTNYLVEVTKVAEKHNSGFVGNKTQIVKNNALLITGRRLLTITK